MEQERDEWDDATDQAIEVSGGDPRAAVKALLISNAFLEDELEMRTPACLASAYLA